MASFREAFLGKRFVCCALTIVYSIYNTIGRSIASIYDLGGIFTLGRIYWLWTSLPYYVYNIYADPYSECRWYIFHIHHLFKFMHIACLPLMHPSDITIATIILQSKKTEYRKFEIVQVNIQIKTGTRPKIDIKMESWIASWRETQFTAYRLTLMLKVQPCIPWNCSFFTSSLSGFPSTAWTSCTCGVWSWLQLSGQLAGGLDSSCTLQLQLASLSTLQTAFCCWAVVRL